MPFTNLEGRHFSAAEKTSINNALQVLETVLNPKTVNLTPKERNDYASVAESNKLIVNKVKDYRDNQPGLSSPDVDWNEFMLDYDSRAYIKAVLLRIGSLAQLLDNARILHDWDNYQASLDDYKYTKYKNSTGATGYEVKERELSQFFNRTGTSNSSDDTQ